MPLLRIVEYPDPVLKTRAKPVANLTGDVAQLVESMAETMYAAPGIGLAAPQVGVSQRIIVLDVRAAEGESPKGLLRLVNPEIVAREGEIVWEEGCLSVPDLTTPVTRARRIIVRAWTPEEREIEVEADELLAVALQHEIDHLDGTLYIDRMQTRSFSTAEQAKARFGGKPIAEIRRDLGL
jgi:peptide deformylase